MGHVMFGNVSLPLETERQYVFDNEVPTKKVEGGKELSDNIDKKTDRFTFNVVISPDDPSLSEDQKKDIIKDKLNQLKTIRDKGRVFRLVTPETVVEQAAISSIQANKDKRLAYTATVQVRELLTVSKEETEDESGKTDAGKRPDLDGGDPAEQVPQEEAPWLFPAFSGGG